MFNKSLISSFLGFSKTVISTRYPGKSFSKSILNWFIWLLEVSWAFLLTINSIKHSLFLQVFVKSSGEEYSPRVLSLSSSSPSPNNFLNHSIILLNI